MTSLLKTKTRVGRIAYTNCLPFYHGFLSSEDGPYEFVEEVPAKLNQAMHRGELDIAPISSLEYLNHQKDYVLFPEYVIGSRDFSGSVLLLSHDKLETLNGKTVAVTRESLSSASLLKILLKFKYKFDTQFVVLPSEPEKMLSKHRAALVIGDDALFYQGKTFVYKYDLSELWWDWTQKPFCFALWAVRRSFAEERPEEVLTFYRALKSQVAANLIDIEKLVREGLSLSFLDEKFPKVFGYLFNLNYHFDADMKEGLELFFRLAHRLGISPRPEKLEFVKGLSS